MNWHREKLFNTNDERIKTLNLILRKNLRTDSKTIYLRQGDKYEKNTITKGGLIENGFMSFHLNRNDAGNALRSICTDIKIGEHLSKNYGFKKWKLVQSMMFDANPSTSLHTDNIFLDSNPSGNLIGILISFNDMSINTGGICFYEYNRKEIDELYSSIYEELPNNFSSPEEIYSIRGRFLQVLKNFCKKKSIDILLAKGEIVSWPSFLPHESLEGSNEINENRFSVAAHYIPYEMDFGTSLGKNSSNYADRFLSDQFIVG